MTHLCSPQLRPISAGSVKSNEHGLFAGSVAKSPLSMNLRSACLARLLPVRYGSSSSFITQIARRRGRQPHIVPRNRHNSNVLIYRERILC